MTEQLNVVSHNETLLKKTENANRSIFILDTLGDLEEVDSHKGGNDAEIF